MGTARQNQYIEIGVGEERYAVKIDEIHEIIRLQEITKLPSTKDYVLGVTSLRGRVIPVISLRRRLGLDPDEYHKASRIVVVNHRGDLAGILVDRVLRVAAYHRILPPPEQDESGRRTYIQGVEGEGSELIGILDLEQLLQDQR